MQKQLNDLQSSVVHAFPGIGKFTTETVKSYDEAGWLSKMYTTIVIHRDQGLTKLIKFLSPSLISRFKQRNFSDIDLSKIKLYPFKELIRIFSSGNLSLTMSDKIWEWSEYGFDQWVAGKLDLDVKIVHAYEHSALAIFERAEELGVFKVLEQTSKYHGSSNCLIEEQFEKFPELKTSYINRISGNLLLKRNARKSREHDLSDLVVCNSSFTRKTLIEGGINEDKIIVVPLAFPPPSEYIQGTIENEKIRFLYAGSINVNKGSHILINVWRKHFANNPNISLTLVGNNMLPDSYLSNLPPNVKVMNYVHQSVLYKLYDESNVFVFPTLADGFGMVITEAMARGLPVIASRNSAGPDLIKHQQDGLLIDAGNAEDLFNQINWCITNKQEIQQLGKGAHEKAKSWQWDDYRKALSKQIGEEWAKKNNC
jgi:glycosyltransferase involved in cell wall biosynthesis